MPGFLDCLITHQLAIWDIWENLKYVKWFLLAFGMTLGVFGFRLACSLSPTSILSQICIVLSFLIGAIGLFTVMYMLSIFFLAEIIRGGRSNEPATTDRNSPQLNEDDHAAQIDLPPPYELAVNPPYGFQEMGTT